MLNKIQKYFLFIIGSLFLLLQNDTIASPTIAAPVSGNSTVSILASGAKCDWNGTTGTDDTAAIQAAFNAAGAQGANLVTFPLALCRITAPIIVSSYLSNVSGAGASSGLIADYTAWHGSDYRAFQVIDNSGNVSFARVFRDFSITGYGNAGVVSVGFATYSSINHVNGQSHYVVGLNVNNVSVNGFDTGFQFSDLIESTISSVWVSNSRSGIDMFGQSLNVSIYGAFISFPSFSHTSTPGTLSEGFTFENKTYADGSHRPEGITISNSTTLTSQAVILNGGLMIGLHHNIFDQCVSDCVVIQGTAVMPQITNNWIYTSGGSADVLVVAPTGGEDTSGIIDSNNMDGPNKAGSMAGIHFTSGSARRSNWKITGNHFAFTNFPILFDLTPSYSVVSGNTGQSNIIANTTTHIPALITITEAGTSVGVGTTIDENKSSDSVLPVNNNGTGFIMGTNSSPIATTTH